MADSVSCILRSDPDISGIGVRIAIYVQNILSFVPAIFVLRDGEITLAELRSIKTQSTTILITAFAILISAMVEARTSGLTSFHAYIVLSLSWMNNTNTFIYFALYVQHIYNLPNKSGLARFIQSMADEVLVDIRPTAISQALRKLPAPVQARLRLILQQGDINSDSTSHASIQRRVPVKFTINAASVTRTVFRSVVLFLGTLHLTLMAILGIWLWNSPSSFGPTDSCPVDMLNIIILGRPVSLGSHALRAVSITIYALILIPIVNFFFPAYIILSYFAADRAFSSFFNKILRSPDAWSRYSTPPAFSTLFLLFCIDIVFIVNIELTLRHNRSLQDPSQPESGWTFGQILAILLLAVPLHDLLEILISQEERAQKKQYTWHLTNELRTDSPRLERILYLIDEGANVNTKAEDTRFASALQFAAYAGNLDAVQKLLDRGAEPDLQGGEYETALQAALQPDSPSLDIVKLLLDHKADPNIQCEKYGSALQAAQAMENEEFFKLFPVPATDADPDA